VLDSRSAAVGVTRREAGEHKTLFVVVPPGDQSYFVVVLTEYLVLTQVIAISHAEPATVAARTACHCVLIQRSKRLITTAIKLAIKLTIKL